MSRIMIHKVASRPIKDYVYNDRSVSYDILVVKGPTNRDLYLQETFPKSTHYKKKSSSTYQEFISEYIVLEVIRSEKIQIDDKIWQWSKPAYSRKAIVAYHEKGLLKSPIQRREIPSYPIEGDESVVFIHPLDKTNVKFPVIYSFIKEEGIKAKNIVKNLLKD